MGFIYKPSVFFSASCLIVSLASGHQGYANDIWQRMLQDAYSEHWKLVRQSIPKHSDLPPLLDLSKPAPTESERSWASEPKWEMFGTIKDPGVKGPSQATSIGTEWLDSVGEIYPIQARMSDTIVIATILSASAHISRNQSFVYSLYSLRVSKVLKADKKFRFREGSTITGMCYGGSVLFPSGHLATFLLAHSGFLSMGNQYVLFLFHRFPSSDIYIVAHPYLIQGDAVFPVYQPEIVSKPYQGMPFETFEAKVKAAVAKDVDGY